MQNKEYVEHEDFEEARDKIRWGRAKKSRVIDERDRRITGRTPIGLSGPAAGHARLELRQFLRRLALLRHAVHEHLLQRLLVRIAAIVSATVDPANGCCPLSIS